MSIEVVSGDAATRLVLTSRVRFAELAELAAAARAAADAGRDVEVDLGGAEYLHVGAIQLLISLRTTLVGSSRSMRVAAVSSEMRDSLVRFGLATWMMEKH